MASELLIELLNNKNNLIEILKKLRYIANMLNNKELLKWVTNEIEGYNNKNSIPKYREFKSPCLYYSGINGHVQFSETFLDLNYFTDDRVRKEIESLLDTEIECSISQIEDIIQDKECNDLSMDLSFLCGELFNESGIIASRIFLRIPKSKLIEIENSVFNRVQDIIVELEKTVGIEKLNSLTIDLSKREINEIINQ